MPFTKVAVWHRIKFMQMDPSTLMVSTSDSIHCHPEQKDLHRKPISSHFDTALINDGTGEDIGLDGMSFVLIFCHNIQSFSQKSGYHIRHICVVFSIPECALPLVFTDSTEVPEHLTYVKWYTPLLNSPEPNHLLYKVSLQKDRDGTHICSISLLANIHCSVHLYPKFGALHPKNGLVVMFWTNATPFLSMTLWIGIYRISC